MGERVSACNFSGNREQEKANSCSLCGSPGPFISLILVPHSLSGSQLQVNKFRGALEVNLRKDYVRRQLNS
jgi:hypothetical protein